MDQNAYNFTGNKIYKGEMKDGKFHGQGIYKFADGAARKGEWAHGKLVKEY